MKKLFLFLALSLRADDVELSWLPSQATNVSYNVYWTYPQFPFSLTPATNVRTTNLAVINVTQPTKFKVTALNSLGYESAPTEVVEYLPLVVPPPNALKVTTLPRLPLTFPK